MKATIIIPNINGKGWLKDSIESVYAQTEQDFELIVVDNGSTDESLEQARSYCSRPNFQLIENGSNTGFSHAVNQGIARAKSEFVVLFNNDAFAEPQWLAELIRVAESDEKIFASSTNRASARRGTRECTKPSPFSKTASWASAPSVSATCRIMF